MRRYVHETLVSTPPETLFLAITHIAHWPRWDADVESIEAAEAPSRFSDLSHLPLATMRTVHEFLPAPEGGTRIRVTVEVFGLLGFLWDLLVARKQAAGAEAQTRAFVRYAEQRS